MRDEDRKTLLAERGFSKAETILIASVLGEAGRLPSIYDFVQGIAAIARDRPH